MTTKLADAHIHLFADGYPGKYGAWFPRGGELRAYEAIRAVHRIERALVVGYEGSDWATGNNRYIARLAQQHAWIAPAAFCFSHKPPSAQQCEKLWQDGFCGLSLYLMQESDARHVNDWPESTFTALNARRAIISINAPLGNIATLRPFFARLAGAMILLSHLGLPGQLEKTTVAVARRLMEPLTKQSDLPHVGVKISGFYACNEFPHDAARPVLDVLQKYFGDRRLYWGSDFSPALDHVSFNQTILAAEAIGNPAIFHANLQRALKRVR